ncbi:glucosyl-3-phosphoglycerate synthase [candidate division WOR-3 bacterium]|nr:glucosyl-3-phosphoglycerate synthase [candidate division WOR-3 bacterium]
MSSWFKQNTFHHSQFSNLNELVKLKKHQNISISVALPTLNEEETIAKEILVIKSELMDRYKLIDEIAVIDSGSEDQTMEIARSHGAQVYQAEDILPELKIYKGKGENLWKALYVLSGDIIVYIDADIKNIHPKFVYGLVAPLLIYPEIGYVKAFYERPITIGKKTFPAGGGRVTQILVRPLFNAFFPELSKIIQPLSGEYAGRRKILESVPFFIGYGVETGLLIDISHKFGLFSIAQVDLDKRIHRNQRTSALSRMSYGILQTFLDRAKELKKLDFKKTIPTIFSQLSIQNTKEYTFKKYKIEEIKRPPMVTIKSYANRFHKTPHSRPK